MGQTLQDFVTQGVFAFMVRQRTREAPCCCPRIKWRAFRQFEYFGEIDRELQVRHAARRAHRNLEVIWRALR